MERKTQKGSAALGAMAALAVVFGLTSFYIHQTAAQRFSGMLRTMNQLEGFHSSEVAAWQNLHWDQANMYPANGTNRMPSMMQNSYMDSICTEATCIPNSVTLPTDDGAPISLKQIMQSGANPDPSPQLFRRMIAGSLQLEKPSAEASSTYCGMTTYAGKQKGAKTCLAQPISPPSVGGQWTWMTGVKNADPFTSVMITPGVGHVGAYTPGPGIEVVPGERLFEAHWGVGDELWVFGGRGFDSTGTDYRNLLNSGGSWALLGDFWVYNTRTFQWTWKGGPSTRYARVGQIGADIGVGLSLPYGRTDATSWTDKNGDLWLFSGQVGELDWYGPAGVFLTDLWKYTRSTNTWRLVSGDTKTMAFHYSSTAPFTGFTGHNTDRPGPRARAFVWVDTEGNFWMYGGDIKPGPQGFYNDMWKFDVTLNTWQAIGGDKVPNNYTSSTRKTGPVEYWPGSRVNKSNALHWVGNDGRLYLITHSGMDSSNHVHCFDQIWAFNTTTLKWTIERPGVGAEPDGTARVGTYDMPAPFGLEFLPPSTTVHPGCRVEFQQSQTPDGKIMLMGGYYWASGSTVFPYSQMHIYTDLWTYNPKTNKWEWKYGRSGTTRVSDTGQTYKNGDLGWTFGTKGVRNPGNYFDFAHAHSSSANFVDSQGNFWTGLTPLWRFEP